MSKESIRPCTNKRADCDENVAAEDNPTLVLEDRGGKRIVLERHNRRDLEEIMGAIPPEYNTMPV